LNRIARFLHELKHPHCIECENEMICQSCETLKEQLALSNNEKQKLLELVLDKNRTPETHIEEIDYEKLKPKQTSWNARRQLLEAEDREAAKIIREKSKEQKEVDKLEKELGIASAGAAKEAP